VTFSLPAESVFVSLGCTVKHEGTSAGALEDAVVTDVTWSELSLAMLHDMGRRSTAAESETDKNGILFKIAELLGQRPAPILQENVPEGLAGLPSENLTWNRPCP
jgi:hypothetical protein